MQAACPGCNTTYVLDERQVVDKATTLTCVECGTTWTLGRGRASASSPPKPRPPASPVTASVPGPPTPAPRPAPVTCPRCGHDFAPEAGPPAPAGPSGRSRPGNSARILLVEDQNYFVELTREVLGEGFQTHVVSNLAEATAVLDQEEFDLVILDLSLDDGEDGTRMLRTTKERKIPVLIFTARDETELYGDLWSRLQAAGATDLLIKGINVGEDLRRKVSSMLQTQR